MNESTQPPERKPLGRKVAVSFLGLLSLIWLFIPEPTDAVPVLGWLDEGLAAGILLACLNYLGVPVGKIKSMFEKGEKSYADQQQKSEEKPAKGKVL